MEITEELIWYKLQERMKRSQMQISISHCKLYAATIAIWVRSG